MLLSEAEVAGYTTDITIEQCPFIRP